MQPARAATATGTAATTETKHIHQKLAPRNFWTFQ